MKPITELLKPTTTVSDPWMTVRDAINTMAGEGTDALVVTQNSHITGIVTERDLYTRVLATNQSPRNEHLFSVMTTPVVTAPPTITANQAMHLMLAKGIRHLPIINPDKHLFEMLSLVDVLNEHVRSLENENKTLLAYVSADSPGG